MRRKEKSLQALMIRATERLLAEAPDAVKQQSDAIELTEDQLDVLAMLSEDPKRAFLFQSVQTTVNHALEEYREKWKPKNPRKKTAGHLHDKRPTA